MRPLFRLLSYLPLPLLHALAATLGWLLWWIPNRRRGVVLTNLRHCFPELPKPALHRRARRSLGHELKTLFESPVIWMGSERRLQRLMREMRGLEHLDTALAAGRGVLLLTPHLGSFEVPALMLSRQHSMVGLYKPQPGSLNRLSIEGRTRFGARMVPTEGSVTVRALLPQLRDNGIAYFLPDQDPPAGRGVYAPLFGIPAHTPKLVARLVQSTGARVVFYVGERLPWGRGYVTHFCPAPEGIDDRDVQRATQALNAGVEACIRRCPDQYWWGYKRFRRRPPGAAAFYRTP